MRNPRLLVTADDLTGAGDVGTAMLRRGRGVTVVPACALRRGAGADVQHADQVVLDLDCRDDAPAAVREKIARAHGLLRARCHDHCYHKIDSGLRGALGPQVCALFAVTRAELAAFVPANPDHGRTTRNGVQYIHGRPLARSHLRHDPIHPARCSRVRKALGALPGVSTHLITLDDVRRGARSVRRQLAAVSPRPALVIFDAERNRDLRTIACALKDVRLVIGSAAPAGHLVRAWGVRPRCPQRRVPRRLAAPGRTLIVAGSAAPAALRQNEAVRHLLGEELVLLTPPRAAATCGSRVRSALRRTLADNLRGVGSIIVSGGRTAEDVCDVLGISALRLLTPLAPGISLALARTRAGHERVVILKPGSFGEPDFYLHALRRIRRFLAVAAPWAR